MTGLPSAALLLASMAGPPALEWRAPEGCPTRDDVLASLAALGEQAADDRVRARGVIRQVGGRYQLRLDIHTDRLKQQRTLDADACDTLGEAAALLIAIAVDPLEVAAQRATEPAAPTTRDIAPEAAPEVIVPPIAVPPPDPDPPPTSDPQPAVAPVVKPPPEPISPPVRPAPRGRRQTAGFVRVEGALDAGASQSITGDIAGAVGLLHRRLRAEAHGFYSPPRPLEYGVEQRRVGQLERWALGVRMCGRFVRSVLEVPLCVGGEAGRYHAFGSGITVNPLDSRPPWIALLLGVGFVWSPHPRVGLGARTEFVIAPYQANFTIADAMGAQQRVFTAQPLGVRFSVGVEIRFGPAARKDGTTQPRPR